MCDSEKMDSSGLLLCVELIESVVLDNRPGEDVKLRVLCRKRSLSFCQGEDM